MALVLDTGVVLAAIDRADRDHDRCVELIGGTGDDLVLPAPTLVELDYLLTRQLGTPAIIGLLDDVAQGRFELLDLTGSDYERVGELLGTYGEARIGFVDAAVLTIVERLCETKLATLDRRHFSMMRPRHADALELLPASCSCARTS